MTACALNTALVRQAYQLKSTVAVTLVKDDMFPSYFGPESTKQIPKKLQVQNADIMPCNAVG